MSVFATALCIVTIALGIVNLSLRHALQDATRSFTPLPMQALSQVPDNVVVHVDDASLSALASGLTAWDKVSVDTRRETEEQTGAKQSEKTVGMFNNEWALVKSGATLSVRAWATADEALRAGNGYAAAVYSNRPAWLPAANVVPVQLPIYRFISASVSGFNAKGETGNGVNNVLEATSLSGAPKAIHDIVHSWLTAKLPDNTHSTTTRIITATKTKLR